MMCRTLDLRFGILVSLIISGCDCGGEQLVDARARLNVTPLAVDFGNVVKGDIKFQSVELSNSGASVVHITMHAMDPAAGELAFAAPVPDALAPQQKVQVALAYQPTDLGEDHGTITFASDDGNAPIMVTLHGIGVESGAAVETDGELCDGTMGSMSFGSIGPGMTVERHITVKSAGSSPLTVISAMPEPGTSPEFTIDTSALPKTLQPGEQLVLTARYTPVDGGRDPQNSSLPSAFIITTDAAMNPSLRVSVCGVGVAPGICAHPVPLDLGGAPDGQSVSGHLTLESCGEEPLVLTAVSLANDSTHMTASNFRLTAVPTLPQTLMPGATVDVEVTFDGHMPFGLANGFVQADSNAMGAPQSYFPITAHTAMPCALFVAPSELNFRNVSMGQSATKTVLVGNSGEVDCQISSLAVSTVGGGNDFALASPPATPLTIPSGQSQTVDVSFTPSTAMQIDGELDIVDGGGTTHPVALHGNPPAPTGCVAEVMPTALSFGLASVGSMNHLTLRVIAVGDEACRVTNAQLLHHDPAFALTLPLLRTAFPGIGGVSIDVTYSPTMAVPSADDIQIDYAPFMGGGPGGTLLVGVSGSAADARICVMPAALDFGTVPQGSSANQSITISSCGAVGLGLRGVILSSGTGGPFRISTAPMVPQTIASGATATPALTVTYAPTDPGPHFGQIEILSTDHQTPSVSVPLTGNWAGGCDQILQCRPTNIGFGDTSVGTDKIVRVVCRSLGNTAVTINSANLMGGGPELTLMAQTPATVQPGDAWTLDVRYAPTAPMPASATLQINSNACMGPPAMPISGNGVMHDEPMCLPPSTFSPQVQWSWHTSTVEPTYNNVWSTPLVANLNDDNGDGHIDENDIPEIVFISLNTYSVSDPTASIPGVLRVLNGATGAEEFSVTEPRFADTSQLAIGDLDGDGRPEIIGCRWVTTPMGTGAGNFAGRYITGTLVALDNTGHLIWESDPWSWPADVLWNAAAPAIADLDGDGFAEIIMGRDVWDHNGHILWRGTADYGQVSAGVHSIVADIDLDGHPEVLAGGTAYRADGSVFWQAPGVHEGGTAVGMLDPTDTFPEIVNFSGNTLSVLDHQGMIKWSTIIPSMGATTELPVIADFDGDGLGDIAVADGEAMHVYHGTGGLIWSAPVMDMTCCAGISAFDFEGDGVYELILTDYGTVYVYRGSDGTNIYTAPRPSVTAFEMPIVADIDNDSKGELVVALFDGGGNGGVVAYSNAGDNWVDAPRIWNQQAFHVTNVYESGAIPRVETPIPQAPKVFRGTSAACR